ncbi:hypothetical protein KSP40_PGU014636 [Platanthera guangdongensis]|uniref:Uncharacterized protein n=1 Tax=Platanthera guangdongensis TaxID=2320717 RepID=A0ABR2MZL5_9ASPA
MRGATARAVPRQCCRARDRDTVLRAVRATRGLPRTVPRLCSRARAAVSRPRCDNTAACGVPVRRPSSARGFDSVAARGWPHLGPHMQVAERRSSCTWDCDSAAARGWPHLGPAPPSFLLPHPNTMPPGFLLARLSSPFSNSFSSEDKVEDDLRAEEEEERRKPLAPPPLQATEPVIIAPLPSFPTPQLTIKEKKELASYAHSLGSEM